MPPTPHRFIQYVLTWTLTALIALTLLDALTLELFFVTSLIGVLVMTELMAPFNIQPTWQRRLRWVIVAGLGVFGYIVLQRILELLPAEFSVTF